MGEVKRDKKTSVCGLFDDEQDLSRAVDALRAAGFRSDDVSALLPDRSQTKTFAHEKHTKDPAECAGKLVVGPVDVEPSQDGVGLRCAQSRKEVSELLFSVRVPDVVVLA